jgi:hypothetical protein
MRLRLSILVLIVPLLAACQLSLPGRGGGAEAIPANPLAAEGIEVTSLPTPGVETDDAVAAAPGPRPQPRPDTALTDATPTRPMTQAPVAEAPRGPEQVACEKRGGIWAQAGQSGARSCVAPTRDGGKQCSRESDCDGVCLSRSRTCAPIKPLLGCNAILQDDGREVTLCID